MSSIEPPDHIKNKRRKYTKEELVAYLEREPDITEFSGKELLVHLDSFCVGDTICFGSYVYPFFKKHGPKKIIVTTFFPEFFDNLNDDIVFVAADSSERFLIDKVITVGYEKSSIIHTLNGMSYAAKERLYLDQETQPDKSLFRKREIKRESNKVTIAPESLKLIARWDYPGGWQTVADYLVGNGFSVYNVSYEDYTQLNEVINYNGFDDIDVAISHIVSSRFFIGLSSGLSWLAWAYDIPVVMIAGFTKPQNEFPCYRVFSPIGCSGCFNIFPQIQKSCPIFYGTPRENECHKLISPDMVIEKIKIAIAETDSI